MKSKLKSVLKYLIFVAISGTFLYLALRNTDFEKLAYDFANARYGYVIASMVMGYAAFISRGLRWNLLLEPLGKKAKPWNAVHAIAIGYFANVAVPRAGELARCTSLNTSDDIPINRLFGTVVLERVIDGAILLLLMLLTVILQFENFMAFFTEVLAQKEPSEEGGFFNWKIIVALGLLVSLVVLFFMRHRLKNLPIFAKVRNFWLGFKEGFKSLAQVKNKAAFYGHTIFIWAMYYLMIYVVFKALPVTESLSPSAGLLVFIVGGLGMVVPAPGGIGSYHLLVQGGMVILGVSATDGFSFATLVHSGQFVMTIIAGVVALIYLYLQRLKKDKTTA